MNKRKITIISALATVLLIGSSSLAYFTDRAESTFTGNTGTVLLEEVDSYQDLDNMAPGDSREFGFTYENKGTLSIDTRITYVVTAEGAEGKLGTLTIDEETILEIEGEQSTVSLDGPQLRGTIEEDGDSNSMSKVVKFNMNPELGNEAQDLDIKIDVIVEGKQSRNNPEWGAVSSAKYKVHGKELEVVEESEVIIEEPKVDSDTEVSIDSE